MTHEGGLSKKGPPNWDDRNENLHMSLAPIESYFRKHTRMYQTRRETQWWIQGREERQRWKRLDL